MVVIAGFFLGAVLGALRARRARGNGYDIAHYAAVHGLAFALLGLIATLVLGDRLGLD